MSASLFGKKLQHAARFVLVGHCLSISIAAGNSADWPRFRGPNLDGIALETNWFKPWPKNGPPILWRANIGAGFSSMTVSQGHVYTMGNSNDVDTVYCLEASTGKLVWKHAYPEPLQPKYYEGGPGATPTVDGERVYTLSKSGRVSCFNAVKGELVWEKNIAGELGLKVNEWGFAGSPLVEGDALILNVGSAGTALDKNTGKVVWNNGNNSTGYATAVPFTLEGRRLAAIFAAKHLVIVEAKSGRELWRYLWETGWDNNNSDPIIAGNRFFISSYDRGCALLEVREEKLALVYSNENLRTHMSTAVKIGDHLYGFHGREGKGRPNAFRCLDFNTGKILWETPGLGVGSMIASADRKLIILSETGELVIAEATPKSFRPLARSQVLGGRCWTAPVLADGRIYCRNAKGDLIAVATAGDSAVP
jgi:outer membrane protein assembly factor BamB